jgi:hypothetical protein
MEPANIYIPVTFYLFEYGNGRPYDYILIVTVDSAV